MSVERGSFALTCERGCAWKSLGFPAADKPTRIDEYGMSRRGKR